MTPAPRLRPLVARAAALSLPLALAGCTSWFELEGLEPSDPSYYDFAVRALGFRIAFTLLLVGGALAVVGMAVGWRLASPPSVPERFSTLDLDSLVDSVVRGAIKDNKGGDTRGNAILKEVKEWEKSQAKSIPHTADVEVSALKAAFATLHLDEEQRVLVDDSLEKWEEGLRSRQEIADDLRVLKADRRRLTALAFASPGLLTMVAGVL